ncbi:hypothetical protein MLD38_030396 [Melastoma candidum]|uniref:Uncharacterized protein n=1 Tax=Melastoma candidum TaxID=119954 RepID=A0ACB9MMQ6_9MYRT|nr:hypothetical protein MLD38_030396 [Melastoma candidum]
MIDYISVNIKEGVLTTTGDFDRIQLLDKLRKLFSVKIVRINGQGKDQKGGGGQIAVQKLDLRREKDKQKAMGTPVREKGALPSSRWIQPNQLYNDIGTRHGPPEVW